MCQKCHIITRYEPDADGASEEQSNHRRLAWDEKVRGMLRKMKVFRGVGIIGAAGWVHCAWNNVN